MQLENNLNITQRKQTKITAKRRRKLEEELGICDTGNFSDTGAFDLLHYTLKSNQEFLDDLKNRDVVEDDKQTKLNKMENKRSNKH